MSYLLPSEFAGKMVDSGESKLYMATRDALIRAYMAGAILALAAFYTVLLIIEMYLMIKFAKLGPSSLHTGRYHFEKLEAQAKAQEAQS